MEEVMKNISQLREKLKLVNSQNSTLKQRLSAAQEDIQDHVKELKSTAEDQRFLQNLLHSYAGACVKLKKSSIDVLLKPSCFGIPQKQYLIILESIGEEAWHVSGFNLPLSVSEKQGSRIHSVEELANFIREVKKSVQAYAERNYQVMESEELLEDIGASIWYTTKLQTVVLNLPFNLPTHQEKVSGAVCLDYEVDHILPVRVTTNAPDLDAVKLEVLRKRMSNIFEHFSLLSVIREEFDRDQPEDVSTSRSILYLPSP